MRQSSKTLAINGTTLTLETGILAQQATSSVVARLGDTMVISTVVMSKDVSALSYFPLSVEYVERLYAGGRIKGSRWVKREGRPSDEAILSARLIDRSIRPLFPQDLRHDIQVVITVLSVDGENPPEILAAIATSAALSISKIPWRGPIGVSRVGLVKSGEEEFIINPTNTEEQFLEMDLVVSSARDKVVMIEAGARQIKEEVLERGIKLAGEWNDKIVDLIEEWVSEIGDKKIEVPHDEEKEKAMMLVEKSYKDKIGSLINKGINQEIEGQLSDLIDEIYEQEKENIESRDRVAYALDKIFKKEVRRTILEDKKRPDGRGISEVRPVSAQVGVLPRTHGSAIFQRGETQSLTVATLGPSSLEQLIEGPSGEETKRYMHHYSFPPYSVGEVGRLGAPNRREVGHGALAEKALLPVIPPESQFPYAIRVVSEIMSSNGSTSMAAACGSTLSLMDAGVPLAAPIAGVAIGLISEGSKYIILTDIIGLEDFSGDMDFKIAGSSSGITAIQLDVKSDGLTEKMISEALVRGREARVEMLEKMLSVLPTARQDVSKYAPKIRTIKINVEKIGDIIGTGGKTIRNISTQTGATVDVAEDGTVSVASIDEEAVERAIQWVDLLTREIQKGETFEGTVRRIVSFGAFVEIVPGKEGLVHVSEMAPTFVSDPHDVVEIGQKVKVVVKEIDDYGRINLSMLFGERPPRSETEQERPREERFERRPPGDRRRSFGGPRREGFGSRDRSSGSARSDARPPFRPRGPRRGGPAPFDSLRPDTRNRR